MTAALACRNLPVLTPTAFHQNKRAKINTALLCGGLEYACERRKKIDCGAGARSL